MVQRQRGSRKRGKHRGNLYGVLLVLAGLALLVFLGWWSWSGLEEETRPPVASPSHRGAPPSSVITNPVPNPAVITPSPGPSPLTTAPPAVVIGPGPVPRKTEPPPLIAPPPRPVQNVIEAQLALARIGISCGSMDGVMGSQTKAGLRAFQRRQSLPVTGALDDATRQALLLDGPCFTNYIISSNDLARLRALPSDWTGKSRQPSLDYESALELVAEKSWSHPAYIKELNPGLDWAKVAAGTVIQVPNVIPPPATERAAFLRISLSQRILEAFDARTNLLLHFPCSIARLAEKRPVGRLKVVLVVPNPNYMFNPENFPESEEARRVGRKLLIPPGPNNPVGTVWIGLDKPGYGIHGTPMPEEVGRTESHGCFRLANWNVELLSRFVLAGRPVYVVP